MAAICRVVNKYKSDFDVNIQRGTMWGNPYKAAEHGREKAIQLFEKDFLGAIKSGKINKSHLETLRGMRLGCTCAPKDCHGDIIARVVNRYFKDERTLESLCM